MVRNRTGEEVLAVVSVDGVNVITGETADPSQRSYVLAPHGSVAIQGWRKDLSRIYYDSRANLAARGVLREPVPVAPLPRPFPGFVSDPRG